MIGVLCYVLVQIQSFQDRNADSLLSPCLPGKTASTVLLLESGWHLLGLTIFFCVPGASGWSHLLSEAFQPDLTHGVPGVSVSRL